MSQAQMQSPALSVIKGGESLINLQIDRPVPKSREEAKYGVRVTVKTSPAVEHFIASLGEGGSRSLDVYVRDGWRPTNPGTTLMIRDMQNAGDILIGDGYRLDIPGRALDNHDREEGRYVNLSFLRLVGISEPGGVSFMLKGVSSPDGLRDLKNRIGKALRSLYMEHIRPVSLTVSISAAPEGDDVTVAGSFTALG